MSKNIVILYGHPDDSPERLCSGLTDAYKKSAEQTGHHVKLFKLSDLKFETVKSTSDFRLNKMADDIRIVQDAIKWADHILFIFPLWMGSMPGQFKMLIEQVFRPGFAIDYSKKGFPGKLLKGKTADIVVTMGMPVLAYRGFYFSHGIRNLRRNILYLCGVRPVHVTYCGGVDQADAETHEKWNKKMIYLGANPG